MMSPTDVTGPHILVAEDDRAFADIIQRALKRAGGQVSVAFNGARALQLARETAFDVIVSDFQMPQMDGGQLLAAVREDSASRDAILFLCSAKCYELDSEHMREELGLHGVFYKPFSLNELVQAVEKACLARTLSNSTTAAE